VLVVADDACTLEALRTALREHAEAPSTEAFVIAPALGLAARPLDRRPARLGGGDEHLEATLRAFEEIGVGARGRIGSKDSIRAADDGFREFPADELVVVVHSANAAKWLEQDVIVRCSPPVGRVGCRRRLVDLGCPAVIAWPAMIKISKSRVLHPVRTMGVGAERTPLLVRTPRAGAIQAVDERGLVHWARDHDRIIHFRHAIGDFVPAGSALVEVWGPTNDPAGDERFLGGLFALGDERTIEQDPCGVPKL
jgi:Predicted membrane protein (DUF2254)